MSKPEAKRHFKRPSMSRSSCGIKPFLATNNPDEVTCVTCKEKVVRDRNANLNTIRYIAGNEVMEPDEIMGILQKAFTDANKMHAKASLIASVCGLVEHGVMSKQELIDAFKEAMVETVMQG